MYKVLIQKYSRRKWLEDSFMDIKISEIDTTEALGDTI